MITTKYGSYNGDSWEEYCQAFLKFKYIDYGYQEMIANTHGDLGIEGYTRTGLVFQCYCPDEDYESRKLYQSQTKKINTDLKKLVENKEELKKHLAGVKIEKWIFLTPKISNKELNKYCVNKAKKYRELDEMQDLLSDNFDILVHDEEYYLDSIGILKKISGQKLNVNVEEVKKEKIIEWKKCNTPEIEILKRKINHLFPGKSLESIEDKIDKLLDVYIKKYIKGQELVLTLCNSYPTLFERQQNIKNHIEENLEIEVLTTDLSPKALIDKTKKDYKTHLLADSIGEALDNIVIEEICDEAISSWLIECPLDFGG